jgi:hypothetical protein
LKIFSRRYATQLSAPFWVRGLKPVETHGYHRLSLRDQMYAELTGRDFLLQRGILLAELGRQGLAKIVGLEEGANLDVRLFLQLLSFLLTLESSPSNSSQNGR